METLHGTMRRLEEAVNKSDHDGLRARWESGRFMLTLRKDNNQLPHGMLAELANDLSVHRSELTARMKFAEKFPTDEELTNVIRQFKTWFGIKQHALTTTTRAQKSGGRAVDASVQVADTETHDDAVEGTARLRRVLELLEMEYATLNEEGCKLLAEIEETIQRIKAAVPKLKQVA